MAKFDYGRSKNTAHRLIDKFGAAGAILRWPNYTPDPITLAVVAYDNRQIDGNRILASDKRILISPFAPNGAPVVEPQATQDRIQDASGNIYETLNY